MSAIIISILFAYFALLMIVSRILNRGLRESNDSFFMAGGNTSWWVVSIGMIGASVSGVSFLSVPGTVSSIGFLYLQTALGFILGYILIAKILLPIYYRLPSPSIYEYLQERFGPHAYKTGAWFFLISKLLGTAAKVYVIVLVLHVLAFAQLEIPFLAGTAIIIVMIWLYTRRGGMKTIVWTDLLQTFFMVSALVLINLSLALKLNFNLTDVINLATTSQWSQYFEFNDWNHKQHFAKQFLSGAFIALVMTGLDQDMIQKNRTIRTLSQSQKNMYWYGTAFVPLNFLFLLLGVLMLQYASVNNISLPMRSDELLPYFVGEGHLGTFASICFVVGIVSATFSSADSSLTSLTTSFCVDIAEKKDNIILRKRTHFAFCILLVATIYLIHKINNSSLIDLIYTMVSYTYGPLLGLFTFGLFTRRRTCDRAVPVIAIASPVLCFLLEKWCASSFGYHFGYELLMLNGAITFLGLLALSHQSGEK